MIKSVRIAALLLMLSPAAALAQDFATGLAAAQAGDYAAALREWTPLAAQANLGLMYYKGRGVAVDFSEAARLYQLANMYLRGDGVAQNWPESARLLHAAADQRHVKAQDLLGVLYRNGDVLAQDPAQAVYWFQQGLASAQFSLASQYRKGEGVAQSSAEETRWLRMAAGQGLSKAQVNLGLNYANGVGTAQDLISAHMWINIARVNENEHAEANLHAVEVVMTQPQIDAAAARANTCYNSNYTNCGG
ncbi:MAG: sel1 repeat family protein [Rhodobacteraceae bacterium]|nr:sel1 repeat family protein [Paracoccaceae bacterium]